jgi:two-component system, sensor histidine kinase and response regulator
VSLFYELPAAAKRVTFARTGTNMAASIDLDVAGALKRVGGDRELLVRIIDFVVEDSPQFVNRMETALRSGEYAEVERAAHSLKGLVSNLHCKAVQDKAVEIESLAHVGDRAAIGKAIEVLSQLTQEMMLKINETRRSLEAQLRTS